MQKLVVNILAENIDGNLVCYCVTRRFGMSRKIVLLGQGEKIGFNPYLVYMDALTQYLPPDAKIGDASDITILVFQATSGQLADYPDQ
jgi:hypothetical protein